MPQQKKKKAQICQTKVTYLGYQLGNGQRWLTEARKQAVSLIPPLKNPRQMRAFLVTVGFCRLWIPGFAEMAAPLYPLTKQNTPFTWGRDQQDAFEKIKRAPLSTPALGLPDVTKPFGLYVDERQGIAKGGADPETGAIEKAHCLPFQETGQCCCRMATMPANGGGYCHPYKRLK